MSGNNLLRVAAPDATLLIATYNRAVLLDRTLASIRDLRVAPGRTWDVIVVDNNSTDDTRAVVERQARDFPVTLTYLLSHARDARARSTPASPHRAGR